MWMGMRNVRPVSELTLVEVRRVRGDTLAFQTFYRDVCVCIPPPPPSPRWDPEAAAGGRFV